jgi:hypothetical protein
MINKICVIAVLVFSTLFIYSCKNKPTNRMTTPQNLANEIIYGQLIALIMGKPSKHNSIRVYVGKFSYGCLGCCRWCIGRS